VRQGIWWWRAAVTGQWALRPGQQADQPAPGVAQMVRLVQFAPRCEDGWRRWFAATGIQPGQVRGVAMLLKRYANCIDGQELAANDRIAQALEDGGV